MSQRSTRAGVFLPALILVTSTVCLLGAAVWVEADRKPPPRFPLTLFALARSEDYLDDEVCAGCHPSIAAEFPRTYHAAHVRDTKLPAEKRGCQACHGPGQNHISNLEDPAKIGQHIVRYGKIKPAEASAACMRCHETVMHSARWARTAHARNGVGCTDCHTVHHVRRSSLVAEEKPASADLRGALSPMYS